MTKIYGGGIFTTASFNPHFMKNFLPTALLGYLLLCSNLATAQKPAAVSQTFCGTSGPTKEYLATHPDAKARMEAIETQTQRFVGQASATAQKETPGTLAKPLIIIPVVVHLLYYTSSNPVYTYNDVPNLSDAVVQEQIESLNVDFQKLNTDVTQVPTAFASLVGNARVAFCLATRDPNGNATTGITRRAVGYNNQYFFYWDPEMKSTTSGGTDAWDPEQYLNIWCCRLDEGYGVVGFSTIQGLAPRNEDGVVVDYRSFGKGPHLSVPNRRGLGRSLTHEVGHWLNLQHLWGDYNPPIPATVCGDDGVLDTPYQQGGGNLRKPVFPRVSVPCNNGPNGDMFMNYMDNTDDDAKFMFSAGQVLRMQANFAAGGYRELLRTSQGLIPVLSIGNLRTLPSALLCGDRTDYGFRVNPLTVGCGGGSIQYTWAATGGWTVTYPNQLYPQIIPSGTGPSTITLTGTYTDYNGVATVLNTASRTVNYRAVPPAPAFTGSPAMVCSGQAATFSATPVTGASGYRWTVPAGFTAPGQTLTNGQTTTTAPNLTIVANAGLAGGTYSVQCQTLVGTGCAPSVAATRSFQVNGGPLYNIVDVYPDQRYQGTVCQRNYIDLALVSPTPGNPAPISGIVWSCNASPIQIPTTGVTQVVYKTLPAGGINFTISADYVDACRNPRTATYSAITAGIGYPWDPRLAQNSTYNCSLRFYNSIPTPYPNPATTNLQLPGYRGTVVIYNQLGRATHSLQAPGTDYGATVDVSAWPEGLYVVTGRDLSGKFVRRNVQIHH